MKKKYDDELGTIPWGRDHYIKCYPRFDRLSDKYVQCFSQTLQVIINITSSCRLSNYSRKMVRREVK